MPVFPLIFPVENYTAFCLTRQFLRQAQHENPGHGISFNNDFFGPNLDKAQEKNLNQPPSILELLNKLSMEFEYFLNDLKAAIEEFKKTGFENNYFDDNSIAYLRVFNDTYLTAMIGFLEPLTKTQNQYSNPKEKPHKSILNNHYDNFIEQNSTINKEASSNSSNKLDKITELLKKVEYCLLVNDGNNIQICIGSIPDSDVNLDGWYQDLNQLIASYSGITLSKEDDTLTFTSTSSKSSLWINLSDLLSNSQGMAYNF